jgi:hypothetical protein
VAGRFGLRGSDQPFLVFAVIDALLAVVVFLSVPYAVWAVLSLSIVGFIGLSLTFDKSVREKALDRVIWGLDAATIVLTGYLLFVK